MLINGSAALTLGPACIPCDGSLLQTHCGAGEGDGGAAADG